MYAFKTLHSLCITYLLVIINNWMKIEINYYFYIFKELISYNIFEYFENMHYYL